MSTFSHRNILGFLLNFKKLMKFHKKSKFFLLFGFQLYCECNTIATNIQTNDNKWEIYQKTANTMFFLDKQYTKGKYFTNVILILENFLRTKIIQVKSSPCGKENFILLEELFIWGKFLGIALYIKKNLIIS